MERLSRGYGRGLGWANKRTTLAGCDGAATGQAVLRVVRIEA